jgi:hypothetical protein
MKRERLTRAQKRVVAQNLFRYRNTDYIRTYVVTNKKTEQAWAGWERLQSELERSILDSIDGGISSSDFSDLLSKNGFEMFWDKYEKEKLLYDYDESLEEIFPDNSPDLVIEGEMRKELQIAEESK